MRAVFDALAELLPTAVSGSLEAWRTHPEASRSAVAALSAASAELASHGAEHDVSFRFLSRSLASETRALKWHLEGERYISAAIVTKRVVDTCIACHVRLPPDHTDFPGALLARVEQDRIGPFARASLQIAARQFDAALQTHEAQLRNPSAELDSFTLASGLNSYLIVALRVKRDPGRVSRSLTELARRTDLAAQLELNLPLWQQALVELTPSLHEPPSLERAQEIFDAGRARSLYPADAADRIHAIVASSVLFRYLDERAPEGRELAEALFLLSRTEAFTRDSFDVPESCAYLEQAIQAAPHSPIAERAYARLELQMLLQFASPDGLTLPAHIHSWLKELRARASTHPDPADPPGGAVAAARRGELSAVDTRGRRESLHPQSAQPGASAEKGLTSRGPDSWRLLHEPAALEQAQAASGQKRLRVRRPTTQIDVGAQNPVSHAGTVHAASQSHDPSAASPGR
jgi:hypothetical protein